MRVRPASYHCSCCRPAGALEPSLADYNTVLQLEPRNVDALYYRGTVFEKLARLDEAITDFTAVLTLDPNHIKASYARGACRNLKGDFQKAIGASGWHVCAGRMSGQAHKGVCVVMHSCQDSVVDVWRASSSCRCCCCRCCRGLHICSGAGQEAVAGCTAQRPQQQAQPARGPADQVGDQHQRGGGSGRSSERAQLARAVHSHQQRDWVGADGP